MELKCLFKLQNETKSDLFSQFFYMHDNIYVLAYIHTYTHTQVRSCAKLLSSLALFGDKKKNCHKCVQIPNNWLILWNFHLNLILTITKTFIIEVHVKGVNFFLEKIQSYVNYNFYYMFVNNYILLSLKINICSYIM